MKEYFTVHEFAKLSGVEASKLRFYDDIGLFMPIKRDPENNYRYYAMEQLLTLNFITVLSDLQLPLKTIAELRKERNPVEILRLLDRQEKKMAKELSELRHRYSIIHARRELINYGAVLVNGFKAVNGIRIDAGEEPENAVDVDETVVTILYRDNKEYVLWPRNEYNEGDTFIEPLAFFVNKVEEQRVNLDFPVGGYWDNMDSFCKGPGKPDHFISIDPAGTSVRKEGYYLVGFSRGYYGEMGDLPERMVEFASKNSLNISGPVLVMYLHDEVCIRDTTQYLAQACIAVSKPKRRHPKQEG